MRKGGVDRLGSSKFCIRAGVLKYLPVSLVVGTGKKITTLPSLKAKHTPRRWEKAAEAEYLSVNDRHRVTEGGGEGTGGANLG